MLNLCSSPGTDDCLGVWLALLSNCWLPALRAPFHTSIQGCIHTFPPELLYGPETGPGLGLAKLHDQSHKYIFKTLNTGANECGGRDLWLRACCSQARSQEEVPEKKNMQEKILEPAPITFPLPLHTTGTKFLQTSAPSKPENDVMDRVIQRSPGSKTSNWVPEVVSFTTDMLWGLSTITHRLSDLPKPAATKQPTVLGRTQILCSCSGYVISP